MRATKVESYKSWELQKLRATEVESYKCQELQSWELQKLKASKVESYKSGELQSGELQKSRAKKVKNYAIWELCKLRAVTKRLSALFQFLIILDTYIYNWRNGKIAAKLFEPSNGPLCRFLITLVYSEYLDNITL